MRGRTAVWLIGVATLSVLLLERAPEDAAAASKNKVACYTESFPDPGVGPVLRTRPEECIFRLEGQGPSNASNTVTQNVKWKKWGSKRAKGKGTAVHGGMGSGNYTVRITLTKPVKSCGHRVYSKAKFRDPDADTPYPAVRIDTC